MFYAKFCVLILSLLSLFGASVFLSPMSYAVADSTNQGRWTTPTENNLPDRQVPGFLVNLGPTGARAVLTQTTFIVRYVFASSPAVSRLMLEDVITGVFGRPFAAHRFNGGHGYEGPIMDFGNAIEQAEGSDGKLVLNVLRGTTAMNITIDLDPIGSFSSTFPLSCPKSTTLRGNALQYFIDHPDSQNVWQSHARAAVTLALLTSDVPTQQYAGKSMALSWSRENPDAGTWTWNLSHQLITICEYYRLTQDASVLPKIKTLVEYLEKAQYSGHIVVWDPAGGADAAQQLYSGGFGHAPYIPGLGENGGYGPNGYGPMQNSTILALTAWQCAARCGVRLKPDHVQRAMNFIHRGTNAAGYVAYGGEFTMNNGPVDAVAWKNSTGGDNYVGRTGAAMIAHKLSPELAESAAYIFTYKSYCKSAYKSLPDGHADSNLGLFWGLLGVATSGENVVMRTVFDYHKAFINMMRCHDGSFVLLPGRDYADNGYYMASRYHPTATMALVLGLSTPTLMIQGVVAPVTAPENHAPVLIVPIPNQTWDGSGSKSSSFANETFTDDDGDALTYRATLDGVALPSWMMIDSASRTLSGNPPSSAEGTHTVVVTADDSYGGTATDTFKVTVTNANDPAAEKKCGLGAISAFSGLFLLLGLMQFLRRGRRQWQL